MFRQSNVPSLAKSLIPGSWEAEDSLASQSTRPELVHGARESKIPFHSTKEVGFPLDCEGIRSSQHATT